jgi:hypothetical protein
MESKFWEPVTELEIMALDDRSEPMRDDPEDPQEYGCVVIGFDLSDPEGCRSILTITADNDRAADEEFAKRLIFCLNNIGECPKCGGGPLYVDRDDAQRDVAHCDDCGEEMSMDEYRTAVAEYSARAKEI